MCNGGLASGFLVPDLGVPSPAFLCRLQQKYPAACMKMRETLTDMNMYSKYTTYGVGMEGIVRCSAVWRSN